MLLTKHTQQLLYIYIIEKKQSCVIQICPFINIQNKYFKHRLLAVGTITTKNPALSHCGLLGTIKVKYYLL